MRHHHLAIAVLSAWSVGLLTAADAQVQRSGGESQKILQQYQQLAAEKTALQTQLAQMKKDLDSAKADFAAMKRERDALKARAPGIPATTVAQLTASKEAAERSLDQSKQRMTELVGRFRETVTSLKTAEAERTKLRSDLDARNALFDKCVEDNMQFYQINDEILNRYDHVGVFTRVSADDLFTKITRNRIDNLVVEYRARAEELREKKRTP